MPSAILAMIVAAAASGEPAGSAETPPPRFHEYSQAASAALRAEATASNSRERARAVRSLCELFTQLRRDGRLAESDTLTALKNKLWGRLKRVKADFQRAERRGGGPEQAANDDATAARSLLEAACSDLTMAASPGAGAAAAPLALDAALGGRAVIGDHGPALVALIERTIAPDKWDTNGGPFAIVYYAPLRALVVRATDDSHHDLGGLLNQMRAPGN